MGKVGFFNEKAPGNLWKTSGGIMPFANGSSVMIMRINVESCHLITTLRPSTT